MNARSPRSHDAVEGQQTLANWLALFALLALGIVWPPANTVSTATGSAAAAQRSHAVVTHNAAAQVSRRACLAGIAR